MKVHYRCRGSGRFPWWRWWQSSVRQVKQKNLSMPQQVHCMQPGSGIMLSEMESYENGTMDLCYVAKKPPGVVLQPAEHLMKPPAWGFDLGLAFYWQLEGMPPNPQFLYSPNHFLSLRHGISFHSWMTLTFPWHRYYLINFTLKATGLNWNIFKTKSKWLALLAKYKWIYIDFLLKVKTLRSDSI